MCVDIVNGLLCYLDIHNWENFITAYAFGKSGNSTFIIRTIYQFEHFIVEIKQSKSTKPKNEQNRNTQ